MVAKQFKESPVLFERTARHWSNVYAGGSHTQPDFDDKVLRLVDMGIDEHRARVALSSHNWQLELATENLFS